MTFKRCAGDWNEGYNKRIDAQRNHPLAEAEDFRWRVTKAREDICRHLAAAKDGHSRRKRTHVALDGHLRFSRHDALANGRRDSFEMHPQRVCASAAQTLKPDVVVRWFALHLNGQIDGGFHGRSTVCQNRAAPIRTGGRASRHDHVLDPIKLNRCLCNFCQLRRGFMRQGTAGGEGLPDGAELACLRATLIADASLQNGRRQHITAVQHGNLRIGNSVRRLQPVKSWLERKANVGQRHAIAQHARFSGRIGRVDVIGALKCIGRMDRHHHGHVVDGDGLVVGRSSATAAAVRTNLGVSQPHSERLQFVDQLFRRLHLQIDALYQRFHGIGSPVQWNWMRPCCAWLRSGDHPKQD